MTLLTLFIASLWLFAAAADYAGYLYYWQLKWYRWDRFLDFLRSVQGKQFFFRKSFIVRSLIAVGIFLVPIVEGTLLQQIIVLFLCADLLHILIYKRAKKTFKRPAMSGKALVILGITILLELGAFFFVAWEALLLLIIVRPVTISFVVRCIDFLTGLIKKIYFLRARKKLARYKQLKVIGITGSYGKTSVKDMLASILGEKFVVKKTPRNVNSDLGVSRYILNTDFSDTDIFIVEMGAYNVGDIKLVCDIVNPTIGILTAISEQHLSLFGSIENIQTAKYELLRALPVSGYGVTNMDNVYCREFLDELSVPVETFGIEKANAPTLLLQNITSTLQGVSGDAVMSQQTYEIRTNLVGEHNMYNVAACLLVAHHLGMTDEEILSAVAGLERPERSLHAFQYGRATIIDDSYSSNPDGFAAALNVLASYPNDQKRIVITRGMLELGERSDQLHVEVGKRIANVADELVIYTPDAVGSLTKGVRDSTKTTITLITDVDELMSYMQAVKESNAVVLIENRIPESVKKELQQHA